MVSYWSGTWHDSGRRATHHAIMPRGCHIAATTSVNPESLDIEHHTWHLLQDPKIFPVLTDLTNCGTQYTANFAQPLYEIAAQLLKTTGGSLDTGFDHEVDVRAGGNLEATENEYSKEGPAALSIRSLFFNLRGMAAVI